MKRYVATWLHGCRAAIFAAVPLLLLLLAGCKTADTKVGLTTNEGPRLKESVSAPAPTR
jgi:hypothetical protein